jgi:hypothetical protein
VDGEVFEAIEGAGRPRGLVAVSWCSSSSPHEVPIKMIQMNSIKTTGQITGYIVNHFGIGQLVAGQARFATVSIESQKKISGHGNQSRSVRLRGAGLLCRRGQLT